MTERGRDGEVDGATISTSRSTTSDSCSLPLDVVLLPATNNIWQARAAEKMGSIDKFLSTLDQWTERSTGGKRYPSSTDRPEMYKQHLYAVMTAAEKREWSDFIEDKRPVRFD